MTDFELKTLQTLGSVLLLLLIRLVVSKIITKRLSTANFSVQRKKITGKALGLFYALILLVAVAGIWGLEGKQVLTFVTSILTVIGVGFFAQWSLLSNITSGLLLYFNHPLKLGDYVSIVDKDSPLAGTVEDISLFFLHIKDDKDVTYTIPNTLVMQKTLTIGRLEKELSESTDDDQG